jgi:F-type H+-transporting ATPase subunit delta
MKSQKVARREARQLFRLCLMDGTLDEDRARGVVQRLVDTNRRGALRVLSRFQRLVRLDRTAHHAEVTSAVPLPPDVRAQLEAGVARLYGTRVLTSFAEDPMLLGGVRVAVGSDVYDGTVRGALTELEAHF